MWRLADGAVDRNSPYSYLMLCEHFADTCAIGTIDGAPVGFVTGFRLPADAETVFVWQIVTMPESRGSGVATALLDHLVDRPTVPRTRFIEATVTPDNAASMKLFRGFAHRRSAACDEALQFAASDFPVAHEPEHRLRIGPF
jgi:L-2,4-diaminobutyric acid acetyltransferase